MEKSRMILRLSMPLTALLLLINFSSCKTEKSKNPDVIETELPTDFIAFYDRFHTDSIFQLGHIVFPLEGKRPDSIGTDIWDPDIWVMHKSFTDMGSFKRIFSVFNGIVIEKIVDHSGHYEMERMWSKLGNQWHLIYYKDIGRTE